MRQDIIIITKNVMAPRAGRSGGAELQMRGDEYLTSPARGQMATFSPIFFFSLFVIVTRIEHRKAYC